MSNHSGGKVHPMTNRFNCLIMGAAGRDFHNFQTFFRGRPQFHVRAFTAAQIPFIESRRFPRTLAGPGYADDIPIFAESRLTDLINQLDIDLVFFSYSDVSHAEVMQKASLVQSYGAGFVLLGPHQTQLVPHRPLVSVTAVRTGAGKSPVTRWLAKAFTADRKRVAILRHPMPYGDLRLQEVERFESLSDLEKHACTIEEREEYEPYLELGLVVFGGIDYQRILEQAESEAEVLLWDGGNNDFSFVRPSVSIVIVDARRPADATTYYPGATNLLAADLVVINKVDRALLKDVASLRQTIRSANPSADIVEGDLAVTADQPGRIRGRRVLVIEDGPTLTHGGMPDGAGWVAAQIFGAAEVVDPRPAAVGTIADAYARYPHMGRVLPALGYSPGQREELRRTIEDSGAELVVDASPCRIDRVLDLSLPVVRVSYEFRQRAGPDLFSLVVSQLSSSTASPTRETETDR
jgi:predicted GTPase